MKVVEKTGKPEKKAGEAPAKQAEAKFYKQQILDSRRYQHRRDVLSVLLEDEKTYSHADIERTIEKFLKGKVN